MLSENAQDWIIDSIAKEMAARGYREVKKDGELAVNILVILSSGGAMTAYVDYYSYMPAGWGGYYPFGLGTGNVYFSNYSYLQGALVVDVFEAKEKHLIWQGVASGMVNDAVPERDTYSRAPRIVGKMFQRFPRKKVR
jgi:hypothetical protein